MGRKSFLLVFVLALATVVAAADATFHASYSPAVQRREQRRGVMLSQYVVTEDDFRTLKTWGVTLARYQMYPVGERWKGKTGTPEGFLSWLDWKLGVLTSDVLPLARHYDIPLVVDLHVPPGGRGANMKMLDDPVWAECFLSCWRRIATVLKDKPGIWAYDLINEPTQFKASAAVCDYLEIQRRAAEVVRTIDPEIPVIVSCNADVAWCAPSAFARLAPIAITNVYYQFHMYEPFAYTHQRVLPQFQKTVAAYPDEAKGWTTEGIRRILSPVRDFERRYGAKIFVGEFSAVAFAEGCDVWLGDVTTILNEYGWSWCYHAFREWPGWSVEHESIGPQKFCPSQDNPRRRMLLRGLRGEFAPSPSDAEKHHSAEMNKTEVSVDGVGQRDVRLLVLGNSIALHGAAPKLGWTNLWGMAASSMDRDFAHLVARGLERRFGKTVDLRIRNLYRFESDVSGYDMRSHDETAWKPDVVVIALGENVPEKDIPSFGERLVELGTLYHKANPSAQIVYRTVFWPNAAKDVEIREAASKVPGALLADLKGVGANPSNTAKGYFTHPGVAAHPGDAGMRRIAEAIIVALTTGR